MANLNTWAEHLERQRGTATYTFDINEPGGYILEIRPTGLVIVLRDRPLNAPVFKVDLDNAPVSEDDA